MKSASELTAAIGQSINEVGQTDDEIENAVSATWAVLNNFQDFVIEGFKGDSWPPDFAPNTIPDVVRGRHRAITKNRRGGQSQ
jgi:hypothetical protein